MKRQEKEKYSEVMNEMVREYEKTDSNAKLNVAVAIYLATYFDRQQSCQEYITANASDNNFKQFLDLWLKENEARLKEQNDPETYKF